MVDEYSTVAKYYDGSYSVKVDLQDLPFYQDVATRYGGPILEIACGTGRIALPLARQGHQLVGLDASQAMLDTFKDALSREPKAVQDRVSLAQGDMRDFNLKKKFSLVTIPFRPLQHMHSLDDQIAALTCARHHLDSSGGVLAFDVFFPRWDFIMSGIGEEKLELEWQNPLNSKQTIKRFFKKEYADKIRQVFGGKFIYRTFEENLQVGEETWDLKMSIYTYPQLLALFRLSGLRVQEEYGSYDKGPLDNQASQMIFVLDAK